MDGARRRGARVLSPKASTLDRPNEVENATRVAVVAALSATTMLFASLSSAYLVRRSFSDWRPMPAMWPLALLAFALAASIGIEVATQAGGGRRRLGLIGLACGSGLYLVTVIAVIRSLVLGAGVVATPFNAFVVLLLGLHALHAAVGGAFAWWSLRVASARPSASGFFPARLVTHFLTALLCAILFLLFGVR